MQPMKNVVLKALIQVDTQYHETMSFFRKRGRHFVPIARKIYGGSTCTFIEVDHSDLCDYIEEQLRSTGQAQYYLEHPELGIRPFSMDKEDWPIRRALEHVRFVLRNNCFTIGP